MSNSSDFVIKNGSIYDRNAVLLDKYTGNEEHVTVPDGVTEIGWQAFARNGNLKSITLPDSIKDLDPRAFPDWGKTLADENGFCIAGRFLVNYTGSDSTLTIPEGITKICFSAVAGNPNIRKVIFPSTIEVIGNQSFAQCESLKEVAFAGCGENLHSIEYGAFARCVNLEIVELPDHAVEMGQNVFSGCDKSNNG